MIRNKMKPLIIGDKIAKLPIIQGGMGVGISLSGLASAVANEGGIGVISAAGVGMFEWKTRDHNLNNANELRLEIRKAKEKTKGILGVNIMVALSSYGDLVEVSIDEGIDIIFAGAGLPLDLPKYLKGNTHTKLVPIISSGRGARIITQKWLRKYDYLPDAFVLEGPKAGGHLGFKLEQLEDEAYSLENLLEEFLKEIKPYEEQYGRTIPVIVAGGVYSGKDIYDFLDKGAAGIQMATRFVTTHECDASIDFKQVYINAKKEDIGIIKSPVGMPGRAIINNYLHDVKSGLKHPFKCPFDCIVTCKREQAPYCISLALINAKKGNMKNGFAFAGSNAYKATSILSVKELILSLKLEYNEELKLSKKGIVKTLKDYILYNAIWYKDIYIFFLSFTFFL